MTAPSDLPPRSGGSQEQGERRFAVRRRARIAYEIRTPARGLDEPDDDAAQPHGAPWLVLLPGIGFDSAGWDPVVAGLARSFRLVLVDSRGTGASDRLPAMYSVPEMADDVVAVLDDAGIERAHIAGVSLGGMAAQHLAIHHPARVSSLVLACTTPGWPRGVTMPTASLFLLAATQDVPWDVALRRHVENMLSGETVRRRPELVDEVEVHLASRQPSDHTLNVLGGAGMRWSGGTGQSRIQARTLIISGTADTVVDPRNSQVLAQAIPRAALLLLPGLGHLFFWEDPEGTVEAVTAFLRTGVARVPGSGPAAGKGRPVPEGSSEAGG